MLKLYVIGSRIDIQPFKAIGAELIEVQNESLTDILAKLKQSSDQLLVMMTEGLAATVTTEIAAFKKDTKSIFLPIPAISTSPGVRIQEIRKLIARSIGVDLLGQKLEELSRNI